MRIIRSIGLTLVAAVGVVAISAGSASATRVEVPKPRCNDISLNTGHLPGGRDVKDLKDPYANDYELWSQGLNSNWTVNGPKGLTKPGKHAGVSKAAGKNKSGVKRKWRHAVGGPVKTYHGEVVVMPSKPSK